MEATLEELGGRHVLGLVTRGDPAEQWAKIDASGLRGRFRHIEVVRDKDEATYRRLVAAWALEPASDVDDRQLAALGHRAGARRGAAARSTSRARRRGGSSSPSSTRTTARIVRLEFVRGPHPPVLTGEVRDGDAV